MSIQSTCVDMQQFDGEGYFIARGLLDPKIDFQPIKEEYSVLLDGLAKEWYKQGKVSSTFTELSFGDRFCKFTFEGVDCLRHFDITLPSNSAADTPIHLGPAVFNLLRNPRILDVIENLIGGEVYSSPVQHIRIKPPEKAIPTNLLSGLTAAVGWHQDLGVVSAEADETSMVSVWVAILDATEKNGCLQIIPGSHHGELAVHCNYGEGKRRYSQLNIPDQLVPPAHRSLPMKAGDVLFFQKKLMHSSFPNTSNGIRWSFDLRYNRVGQPTGRPWLPGFVARSRSHPEVELKDPTEWADLWLQARSHLAAGEGIKPSSRWNSDHPLCA
ncbi:MAG: phytanoyl-CoA dioxygenase family protein [Terriglobales bacterium]